MEYASGVDVEHQLKKRQNNIGLAGLLGVALLAACGGRTDIHDRPVERPEVIPSPEVCDGVDNDLDSEVDEPWMDDLGRYLHDEACGGCDAPCEADGVVILEASCQDIEGTPICLATECAEGFAPALTGGCVPLIDLLCLPCLDDGDCGTAMGMRCVSVGEELRCTSECELGDCPVGYECQEGQCLPAGGSCWCQPGSGDFTMACTITSDDGELECLGFSRCSGGNLDVCSPYAEICDYLDNDCDGVADDPFVNDFGGYDDIHNCGACGVDCTESPLPEGDLACRGDPAGPQCLLYCEDTADGLDPGDRVDADQIFGNGCECTVTAVDDRAGPIGAVGPELDVNCDGADGIVVQSVYVAPDGTDENRGTPLYPVQSIQAALDIAVASLESARPRPHIFVAAGTYGEVLNVAEGIQIHGGYRRDFLELDPDAYQSVIYTAADVPSLGGAVLIIEDAQEETTLVEGLMLHGASAPEGTSAAYGVVLRDSGSAVTLRNLVIYPGHGAAGRHGEDGDAGVGPSREAGAGALPRPAEEDSRHICLPFDERNEVAGGAGGQNTCDGTAVSGGNGGSAACPTFTESQPEGGRGRGALPGRGGFGGIDSHGPIEGSSVGCNQPIVCCGLADFTVPLDMTYAADGVNGAPGDPGSQGLGCDEALGVFDDSSWEGGIATRGGLGTPGSGGGGGGAGGGAEMDWYNVDCEFADGLGGGGGGGGGGGCGGDGGTPGTGGGPSVGILITYQGTGAPVELPLLEDLTIFSGDGGPGGRGGAGGDGGTGGAGGVGGNLPREDATTPSLAGPTPGAAGGAGGEGGPGGGGGGGCGGSALGVVVWLTSTTSARPGLEDEYRRSCEVTIGRAGEGGAGGGGARAGGDGSDGIAQDVFIH